ncbi:MAG: ATP-binding cassette domain-containing protein [Patescibacteria group bacterium]|jgi:sodium transport system ATP-binding protein
MDTLLLVKHLTKKFHDFTAVEDVNFEARGGEIFGLLGPNGAGKTTTLRTIATALQPTSGTAIVAGYDINEQPEEVKKHIGVLTTDIGVYDRLSGRENLSYFGELYGMSAVDIQRRIKELSDLLEMNDFIERRAGKYSTGMKQKLAIARAVIHNPDILIFDEPTSGLDVLASQTVLNFMKRSKDQGKCVILSTHQMIDAERLCDRVAIIHQGRMIADDTVSNIENITRTENLEDAFLKLIKDVPAEKTSAPITNNNSLKSRLMLTPKWIWSAAIIALAGAHLFFQILPQLETQRSFGYLFIVVAVFILMFNKYYVRRRR